MMATRRRVSIALVSVLLVGCASGRGRVPGEAIPEPIGLGTVVPASEQIPQEEATRFDVRPQPTLEPEIERGLASWYGKKFHGRRTASGERFDMNALTAAHPSLPFDTLLAVHNPRNGRTVTVRVNDRGPYTGKRIIDLSRAAAQAIGLVRVGVGTVVLLRV